MPKAELVWERSNSYARGSTKGEGMVKFRITMENDNGFEEWTVAASRPLTTPLHIDMPFTNCADAIKWCELLWSNC